MIINEIITKNPGSYGGGAPSMQAHRVTPPNISTPRGFSDPVFVKKAKKQKYDREQQFKKLATDKQRFDFLYQLEQGKSSNKISIKGAGDETYHVQQYDPATGDIILLVKTLQGNDMVKGNTKNFLYQGRHGTYAGSPKTYTFVAKDLIPVSSQPKTKRGRPTGPVKKKYQFPPNPW